MTERAEVPEGVHLNSLDKGSVIDIETKNRHYRIEYVGEDKAWISGHPQLCPKPVLVQVQGSTGRNTVESGFIGQGMHLVFLRLNDHVPITTSEVTDISVKPGE